MRKIEIEVLDKNDLAEFPECDGLTWSCAVSVDGELRQILTSDDV
jgi:hypothetical protein